MEPRIRTLAAALDLLPAGSARLSLEEILARLRARAGVPEGGDGRARALTDGHAEALLVDAERALREVLRGRPPWSVATPGEHRLRLAMVGRGPAAVVRVLIPPGLPPDRPAPLVLALHGVGGTEDLLFDGRVAPRLAAERGWLLAAPRLPASGDPPLPGLIGALGEWLPVDRARVALVGHSMGAVQGLAAVERSPATYRALVALSGGRAALLPDLLAGVAVLCAAGERDFGAAGARALHGSLARSGHPDARLRIERARGHADTIHAALPAVFRFLDGALGPR